MPANAMHGRLREFAKILFNQIQYVKVGVLRAFGIVDFPVPPNSIMRRTSASTLRDYFSASLTTYSPVITMARFYGVKFDKSTNVLDFGCGAGSQLMSITRHFPDAKYHAVDIDPSSVAFVKKSYPRVDCYLGGFMPPTKFADCEMDLVYSASTFSHFDLPTQRAWLAELYRITKPGGLVLPTIDGSRSLQFYFTQVSGTDITEIEETLRRDGIFHKDYAWLKQLQQRGPALSPSVDISSYFGGSYGNTTMTPEFVRKNWSAAGFEVLGIAEGVSGGVQDLVVMRRPLDS